MLSVKTPAFVQSFRDRINRNPCRKKILLVKHECSADLSIGHPGAWSQDELDLTKFSGYKFRSASAKGTSSSSAPRARHGLKSALGERVKRKNALHSK
ncbi:hypothetical protein TNCV_957511 [Trichonephila clavipes]|nr:hypothetical protein TNCV_957511 [Trichonephila clavipes]